MNYCINPECKQRQNPDNLEFCQSCGTLLLVGDRYRLLKPLRPPDPRRSTDVFEVDCGGTRKVMKVLKDSNPQLVEMFEREALTLEFLNHPGIPKIDEDGYFTFTPNNSTAELHCLVMEKIEGQNLERWVSEHGAIAQSLALKWLRQLIEILDIVHQNKFLHRDIKPSNIMRKPDGQLVLIDFGNARARTNTYLAKVGMESVTTVFSEGYTPLEQINGQAVLQSDFYALGRTFVHLLTGIPPFEFKANSQTGKLIWQDKAKQISKPLADYIDEMMAVFPADRPSNTTAILPYLSEKGLVIKEFLRLINSPSFKLITRAIGVTGIIGLIIYRASYPLISKNSYDLGVKEQTADRLDKAWKYYEEALKYYPNDARIYNNMGLICQKQKNFTCAQIKYEQALKIDPNNPVARYNLGGVYDDLGDFKSAESQYKLAIESDSPVAVNALNDLARLRILDRDTSTAIELTSRGLQKVDKEQTKIKSTLYKNRGWAHFVQADYAAAKLDLQKGIKYNPKRADSYCLLAQVLEAGSDKKGALAQWRNCREKDSRDSVEVKVWKIMAFQRLKEAGE